MDTTSNQLNVMSGVADANAEAQQREVRASRRFVACLTVFFLIALGLATWLIVSTGVPDVSAAAADVQSPPQVPYFPSLYVNQATEVEPTTATF